MRNWRVSALLRNIPGMRRAIRIGIVADLRPEQLSVWSRYVERGGARQESRASGQSELPAQRQQNQTQYVRINNNAFTPKMEVIALATGVVVPCRPPRKLSRAAAVRRITATWSFCSRMNR